MTVGWQECLVFGALAWALATLGRQAWGIVSTRRSTSFACVGGCAGCSSGGPEAPAVLVSLQPLSPLRFGPQSHRPRTSSPPPTTD